MELIKVAKVGSKVSEVALDTGATVGDALKAAGMTETGFEIRLNGAPSNTAAIVRNGDIVTLVPQIKGGN